MTQLLCEDESEDNFDDVFLEENSREHLMKMTMVQVIMKTTLKMRKGEHEIVFVKD